MSRSTTVNTPATNDIAAVCYHNKARLYLLSNLEGAPEMVDNTEGNRQIFWILKKYRDCLGWVDQFDQSLHQYWYPHRNIKWTRALLLGLIKIAFTNAWIIRKWYTPHNPPTYRQFTIDVIHALTGDTVMRSRRSPTSKGNS